MKTNIVKEKLRNGEAVLGLIEASLTGSQAEILGLLGFDFLLFDTEHGNITDDLLESLLRAADCTDCPALVRVQSHDEKKILRAMDLGACGVLVPMVESREEAAACAAAVRYAPEGSRGLSMGTRAAGYGLSITAKEHIAQTNEQSLVMAQIESVRGLENLDEMLKEKSVDVFFIGPTDLSQSMGYAGDKKDPAVQTAIRGAIARITAAGRIAGIHTGGFEDVRRYYEYGARLITCSSLSICKGALWGFLKDFRGLAR